ncbi:MAG: hypothetical protein DYG89_49340 [Caldilinea sp. CFX5]|nr:hypothetical protein [Caldilinea sp. CFX5]
METDKPNWLTRLHGPHHQRALWLFMVIVLGHWLEHLAQVYQIYVLGWIPKAAGGALGLWFPHLAASEVLHFTYNLFLWGGILWLQPGFRGAARKWWHGAMALQNWHFFEHILLQLQWLTGYYLFGATKQISIGELWFPRVELHFMYNLLVFIPLLIGLILYFGSLSGVEGRTHVVSVQK